MPSNVLRVRKTTPARVLGCKHTQHKPAGHSQLTTQAQRIHCAYHFMRNAPHKDRL